MTTLIPDLQKRLPYDKFKDDKSTYESKRTTNRVKNFQPGCLIDIAQQTLTSWVSRKPAIAGCVSWLETTFNLHVISITLRFLNHSICTVDAKSLL